MAYSTKMAENWVVGCKDADEDTDDSRENDENTLFRNETNANLMYCSNVVVGNELKGPIKVEKMVVLPQNDSSGTQPREQIEYNVGSIQQVFRPEGLKLLEDSFRKNPRPDKVERDRLAQLTGTRRKMVRKWFAIERSKRKRELTVKAPLRSALILWTSSSRKLRRKVLLLVMLISAYALISLYCFFYHTWYEISITSGIAFVLINSILTFLN